MINRCKMCKTEGVRTVKKHAAPNMKEIIRTNGLPRKVKRVKCVKSIADTSIKASQLHALCPYAIVYSYIEFKLNYFKHQKYY